MTELLINQHSIADGVICLAVDGDIDMASGGELRDAIRESFAAAGVRRVIIDLERVPFLDSTGVRTLLDGHLIAIEQGIAFLVTNPQEIVRRVLTISGVLELLTDAA